MTAQGTTTLFHRLGDEVLNTGDFDRADDMIAFRLRMRGTHRGAFAGIPPTGKAVNYTAIGFVRVADGKIAERWLQIDATGLLRQLGSSVVPQPQSRPE